MTDTEKLEALLIKYINNNLNDNERQELEAFLQSSPATGRLFNDLSSSSAMQQKFQTFYSITEKPIIQQSVTATAKPIFRTVFLRRAIAIAAILILAIGSGVYYFNTNPSKSDKSDKSGESEVRTMGKDIAPGTNRAILTINNNQNIDLATNKTGININNTITYNDGERIADAGQMLQLTTPRGGQYQAVLPDGSKVWLNAASSIKFPSKFDGKERRVEVTGEAYFEIAKDATKPFKIYGGSETIEVLGTSFNINAYTEEEATKTTLVEGSVKVSSGKHSAILKPGQAFYKGAVMQASIAQELAWKSGYFKFSNASIEEIMRQLIRWYNIDVVYEGKINTRFLTTINRNLSLQKALSILEQTNAVHFTINGKTITVKP